MNDIDEEKELVDLFAPALSESPVPPDTRSAMQQRLLARTAASKARHAGQTTVRGKDGEWRTIKDGVRAKTLRGSGDGASVLVELTAGAALPVHRHRHMEEGIVLAGSMQLGELDLGPGDYHVSAPGSRHGRISSRDGCLTYLRGTSLGDMLGVVVELLGGLLPGDGEAPVTITTRTGEWLPLAEGVEEKRLWHDTARQSRFIRFAPGGRLPGCRYDTDTEFLVVEGELFCGDILVRSHEFHFAPADTRHEELFSDVGAIVFVHGADVSGKPAG